MFIIGDAYKHFASLSLKDTNHANMHCNIVCIPIIVYFLKIVKKKS